jgi:G:T-mismatch repair DNA endonuclease (very short patch repair protein)
VCSTPVEVPAAARARWLAEVAETLEQAERLLNRLKLSGRCAPLVVELELRIEAAKHEVGSLRMSRQPRTDSGPTWTDFPPWEKEERSGA